jgi:acetyl esterase/lipase
MFPMRLLRVTVASSFVLLLAALPATAQQKVLPLWPHATPEPAQTSDPEKDVTTDKDALISGHRTSRLTNVTHPTMSVYQPTTVPNSGAAALVFPGGSYVRLAWEGEGIDACTWLNSLGITCLLVKYRVPQPPLPAGTPVPLGHYPPHYPADPNDLEDAQQAMRLARQHATEWHIDPSRIGVIGFSAGANLAVLLSTHPDDNHVMSTPAAPDVNATVDARPNFAIIVYPAYLGIPPDLTTLDPIYTPNLFTPPTFLLQAENDHSYGKNAPLYYIALANAHIPAELHMFPSGGHGFGLHPVGRPEEHWTQLAATWLRSISIIPPFIPETRRGPNGGQGYSTPPPPCPSTQLPQPGRPDKTPQPATDPACW